MKEGREGDLREVQTEVDFHFGSEKEEIELKNGRMWGLIKELSLILLFELGFGG